MKKIEFETRPTDKEKQAHSNNANEKSTTKEKNRVTYQNETSELETQQSKETSSKQKFQQTVKGKEDSVSQNVISSDVKVYPQQEEKKLKRSLNQPKCEQFGT